MLSRRDRLLVQPWEERRFKDHRSKETMYTEPAMKSPRLEVVSALPAIDARAPPPRPHVAVKLKKWQREHDRAARVAKDNFSLLQRLGAIMRVNRLDNHWQKPPPNFQHKVGQFYETRELGARLAARMEPADSVDLHYSNVKCYACETRKMQHYKACAPPAQAPPPARERCPLPDIH